MIPPDRAGLGPRMGPGLARTGRTDVARRGRGRIARNLRGVASLRPDPGMAESRKDSSAPCATARVADTRLLALALALVLAAPGCASMRRNAPSPDLRPCDEGFAATQDGWMLGIRRVRPDVPRPGQAPGRPLPRPGPERDVLDDHRRPPARPARRAGGTRSSSSTCGARGPATGSACRARSTRSSARPRSARSAAATGTSTTRRSTTSRRSSTTSGSETGSDRVNWVGHSLGGMLMFPFLELSPEADRIANFVDMGGVAMVVDTPDIREMRRADKGLRVLSLGLSTGRLGRPMMYGRLPGAGEDRPVLLHGGQRRQADGLAVLRLHPGGPRGRGPEAARPVPLDRPDALGRPVDRLRLGARPDHHADPDGRRRGGHHGRHPLDAPDLQRAWAAPTRP